VVNRPLQTLRLPAYYDFSEYFHPNIDADEAPAHRFLRSVHNITIERGWLRLRQHWGDNVYHEFMKGVEFGIYNNADPIQ
jgi:hypothetical protein